MGWEIMIMGPPDTHYEGGFFKASMKFPQDYPNMPPTLKITSDFWHPNVYPDGRVCISILISTISMLASPNLDSPANLDAAKEMRETPDVFKKKVGKCVRRSQEDM